MRLTLARRLALATVVVTFTPLAHTQTLLGDRIVGDSVGGLGHIRSNGTALLEFPTNEGTLVPRYDVRGGYVWQSVNSVVTADATGAVTGGFPITTGAGGSMDLLLDGTVVLTAPGGVAQYDRAGNVLRIVSNGNPASWHSHSVVVLPEQTVLNLTSDGQGTLRIIELELDGTLLSTTTVLPLGGAAVVHVDVDPDGDYWLCSLTGELTEVDASGSIIGGFDAGFGAAWILNGFDVTPTGAIFVARGRAFPPRNEFLTFDPQGTPLSQVQYAPGFMLWSYDVDVVDELPIGAVSCPSFPNSTGTSAELLALGSTVAGANDLRLSATGLPPQQFGYFIASRTAVFIPAAGGAQGALCVGGTAARFLATLQSSGPAGSMFARIDTSAIPTNPVVAIQAGETWYFQGWYRDVNPNPTSNFTEALEIAF